MNAKKSTLLLCVVTYIPVGMMKVIAGKMPSTQLHSAIKIFLLIPI